jgi:hypothetical protein
MEVRTVEDEKLTVTIKLTRGLDRRLDEIAAENVDLAGRSTFNGQPNRSAIIRAFIKAYDRDKLRDVLQSEFSTAA